MVLQNIRRLFTPGVGYQPRPEERPFIGRIEKQHHDDLEVSVAVLDQRESERFFGVPLARRGIQPVWLQITLRPLALLLLRIGLGVVFIYNGYPKIFGRRLEHIDEMIHINHLPAYFVYIAFVLEVVGGGLLIAGLFTRLVGLLLAGEMAIAMWKGEQFFQNPLAVDKYELALVLGVGAFALATFGAGPVSLDRLFFGKGKSPRPAKP